MEKKESINLQKISYEWLDLRKIYVKHSTFIKYKRIITCHIIPYFKNHEISTIDEEMIMEFINYKTSAEHLSINTIKSIKNVLKSVLWFAEQKYHIQHIDFSYVKITYEKLEPKLLTEEQERSIQQYCSLHYNSISVAISLGLYAGLRIGEICALKWENIDLKNGVIKILQTVQRIETLNSNSKTTLMITDPKTFSSKRHIAIPDFFTEYLTKYNSLLYPSTSSYILSNNENVTDPRTIQYQFKKICNRYNFSINFHALRHTYATNCVQLGIDIKTLSEMLGHASVATTLNRYVHSSMEYKKSQINKIKRPSFS